MRFSHSPLNSLVISMAVVLAAFSLRPMLADGDYLLGVFVLAGISGVVGALAALLKSPRMLTVFLQFLALAGSLVFWATRLEPPSASPGGPPHFIDSTSRTVMRGVAAVQDGVLPLESSPALVWMIGAVIALVVISLELLVNCLEQPAWGLAPLAVIYGIGAFALPSEMEWYHFAGVAAGYVAVLLATTGFGGGRRSGPAAHSRKFQFSRFMVAIAVTVATGLLALLITPSLPMASKQPWLSDGNDAPIELSDPTINLTENLNRPTETEVLFYRTSTGEPTYLRTVALTRLTTAGAQLEPMQLSNSGLRGAYDAPGVPLETMVEMVADSEYLPAPWAADSFDAHGRWAHDPGTLAIVATGSNRTAQTNGLRYTVNSTVPNPDANAMSSAMAGSDPAGSETLNVPEGLDPRVAELTASLTAGAGSDGEKALAIQDYLRSEPFTYTLQAPSNTSLDVISEFVLETRAGYCIHFASAMVTMARIEGIPARMAVGYTGGTALEDGFVVTTHNMHTWPELYFEGLGWVPFEPTKSVASAPSFSDPGPVSTPSPSPSPTPSPQPSPSPSPSPSPMPTPPVDPDTPEGPSTQDTIGWILLASVLVVAFLPLVIRATQRMVRLRGGRAPDEAAVSAWREVRATFTDLHLAWDDSSPTLAARHLGQQLSPTSAALLGQVALTVERARYARGGADVSALGSQVRALRKDLLRTQSGSRQVKALFLPVSLRPGRM